MTFRAFEYLRSVRGSTLDGTDRAVLAWLTTYADAEGRAFPGLDTLAGASGFSRATVARSIVRLREAGWLSTSRPRRTASNTYLLLDPSTSQRETSQHATTTSATSQSDACDVAHGDSRQLSVRPATSQPETLSPQVSPQITPQGSLGAVPIFKNGGAKPREWKPKSTRPTEPELTVGEGGIQGDTLAPIPRQPLTPAEIEENRQRQLVALAAFAKENAS